MDATDEIANDPETASKLASWTFANAHMGHSPTINTETVQWMRTHPKPDTKRRAELYLGAAIKKLGGALLGRVPTCDPILRVASWSRTSEDCVALAHYLQTLGAVEAASTQETRMLAKGHILYEEMSSKRALSTQVFVAMSFHTSLNPLYEAGIAVAIRGSGYEPLRIDKANYDGKIDDEIIAQIRLSAFVVADFTQHRGGVYYEAGFAHGLGRRVIFICREDDIPNLHFDVRQYNTILWKEPTDIVKPLQDRILALFGAGPLNPNAKPIV